MFELNSLKNQQQTFLQEERMVGAEPEAGWWLAQAESWYSLAEAAILRESADLGCRLLRHAAEFCLKAVIRYHTGDHPFTRNPYTLLHIAALEVPALRCVFPRTTVEEIRLFAFLNPYRFVPGPVPAVVNSNTLAVLAGRVAELLKMTKEVLGPDAQRR